MSRDDKWQILGTRHPLMETPYFTLFTYCKSAYNCHKNLIERKLTGPLLFEGKRRKNPELNKLLKLEASQLHWRPGSAPNCTVDEWTQREWVLNVPWARQEEHIWILCWGQEWCPCGGQEWCLSPGGSQHQLEMTAPVAGPNGGRPWYRKSRKRLACDGRPAQRGHRLSTYRTLIFHWVQAPRG